MTIKKFLIIGIFLYIPFFLFGQDPLPPLDYCDPEEGIYEDCEPTETPIDDGVFFLLAAAALYAVKKFKTNKDLKEGTT